MILINSIEFNTTRLGENYKPKFFNNPGINPLDYLQPTSIAIELLYLKQFKFSCPDYSNVKS